jgi:hypothetical protein
LFRRPVAVGTVITTTVLLSLCKTFTRTKRRNMKFMFRPCSGFVPATFGRGEA